MSVEVLSAGFFTTIQDLGRYGFQRFGVPASGPMDEFAFRAANLLVGNPENAAALECGPGDLHLRVSTGTLLAVCAPSGELWFGGNSQPLWTAVWAAAGQAIRYEAVTQGGTWSYIAFAGGIATPMDLGSRSTYLRAGLGGLNGRDVQSGDRLELARPGDAPERCIGGSLPKIRRSAYSQNVQLGLTPGPQIDRFDAQVIERLAAGSYLVRADSDRMGYRLEGEPIPAASGADIYSEGMVRGAVQVPASGMPMVMMADCPTSGGYTKIGYVVRADLPLLAQCQPGSGRVSFYWETLEKAQERTIQMITGLRENIQSCGEPDFIQWAGAIK